MQTIAPPAHAVPRSGSSFALPQVSFGSLSSSLVSAIKKLNGTAPATPEPSMTEAPEDFDVVLTPVTTPFTGHVGIDHHQPLLKIVVSSNNPTGLPLNFDSLDADGTHRKPMGDTGG